MLSAVGHFGASVVQLKMADGVEIAERKSCAFFLKRKNRFCRMTVGGGRKYCGEHMVVAGEAEVRNLFFIFETLFWFYVQLQYKLVAVCLILKITINLTFFN